MEKPCYGLLLEDIIGCSHENVLVDDKMITRHLNHKIVRGSLLTKMSRNNAKTIAGDSKPLHNYKFDSSHDSVTLHCKPDQVFSITINQRSLLNGIPRESDRIEMLHYLYQVERLYDGSYVHVTIPTFPTPVRGIVRYIGSLEGEPGTKFGIELQVRSYYCGNCCM